MFAPVIAEEGKEEEGEALSLFAPISRLFPDVTAGDGQNFLPREKGVARGGAAA